MRKFGVAALLALTSLAWAGSASADPWKDESGHGRRGGEYSRNYMSSGHQRDREYRSDRYARQDREYKQEYNDGNCKIERKWEKGGDYKEEIKCKGGTPSRMVQGHSGRRGYAEGRDYSHRSPEYQGYSYPEYPGYPRHPK